MARIGVNSGIAKSIMGSKQGILAKKMLDNAGTAEGRRLLQGQAVGAMRRHPYRTIGAGAVGLGLFANSRVGPRGPRGGYGSSGSSGLNPRSSGGYA